MAQGQRDYYEVLGVPRDADEAAIKDAFRRLALKHHPDRDKSPGAEERFKEIAEAYAVLSDPKKRAEYDARGFPGVSEYSREDLLGGVDFDDLFRDFGFGFGEDLFGRFFRQRAEPARGANLEVRLTLPLERIAHGGEETVRFTREVICPVCRGSGAAPGTSPRTCPTCGGSGRQVTTREERGGMHFRQIGVCSTCLGSGRVIDTPCPQCRAAGRVTREESLRVNIPPGIEEGTVLRVRGRGYASPGDGPPGDLYLVIHSAPDARFSRAGADLWHTETLEAIDAVLGSILRVPTLNGSVEVNVPPGTQPGTVLRLRGRGLPRYTGGGPGDLNVRIDVHIPERLSPKERELFQRLKGARPH